MKKFLIIVKLKSFAMNSLDELNTVDLYQIILN